MAFKMSSDWWIPFALLHFLLLLGRNIQLSCHIIVVLLGQVKYLLKIICSETEGNCTSEDIVLRTTVHSPDLDGADTENWKQLWVWVDALKGWELWSTSENGTHLILPWSFVLIGQSSDCERENTDTQGCLCLQFWNLWKCHAKWHLKSGWSPWAECC